MGRGSKRLRHAAEYAGVRLLLGTFGHLPAVLGAAAARAVADLAFLTLASRRRIAIENILACGIRGEAPAAATLARDSFRHFAVAAVESLRFPALLPDGAWRRHVTVTGPPEMLADGARSETGMIIACGHLGCPDIAAHVFGQYRPLTAIARPLNNPRVDAVMNRIRFSDRFRAIPKHGGDGFRLLEVLRQGGALALMIDQHAGRRGVRTDFLGRPASTSPAVALLALVSRAPVYFGYCVRTGAGRYECGTSGPVPVRRTGNRQHDVTDLLNRLNAELEKCIRRHPEQYLWAHRRWRADDPQASG